MFTIIGLLICIYSLKHFHKGFLFFLIFRLFLGLNIAVIAIPGVPIIRLDMVMTLFFIFIFLINKKIYDKEIVIFPYRISFILLFISWTFSCSMAYIGFIGTLPQYIGNVSKDLLLIWMIWRIVEIKDMKFLMKWFTIVFLMACIYGFIEKITHQNPLRIYSMTLAGDMSVNWTYGIHDERGYRVQSIFEHAIGAGANFVMYILLVLIFSFRFNKNFYRKEIMIFVAILCAITTIFTNSRTPIVFFALSAFSFLDLKNKKLYYYLIPTILFIFLLLPLFSQYSDTFTSLFDSKSQEKISGSSSELRFKQFDATIELTKKSPILGLGFMYYTKMNNELIESLIGRESMWFSILPELGIVGVVANIILALYSIFFIPLKYKCSPIFFVSLAYWIVGSMTSLPGMKMHLYYLIIFILIKNSNVYKKQKLKLNKNV